MVADRDLVKHAGDKHVLGRAGDGDLDVEINGCVGGHFGGDGADCGGERGTWGRGCGGRRG